MGLVQIGGSWGSVGLPARAIVILFSFTIQKEDAASRPFGSVKSVGIQFVAKILT